MDLVPQLTLLVTVSYILALFVTFQAGIGPDSDLSLGWFHTSLLNMSDNYPTPITPAGYTFAIFGVIYTSFAAMLIYIITTLFRTNEKGPVYLNPPTTSPAFLLSLWLFLTLSVTFLFANDRMAFVISLIVQIGMSVSLYVAVSTSVSRVYQYLFIFKEYGKFDLWANRILVHNGLAIYGTWITVSTITNMATTLIYTFGVDEDTTVYICFSILSPLLVTYFLLDCFVYDRYFRYILLVYPTVLWYLGGVLVSSITEPNSPQAVLGSTLFVIVFVFFVVKVLLVIVRDPVYIISKKAKDDEVAYSNLKERFSRELSFVDD